MKQWQTRILCTVMTLVLILGLIPTMASAESDTPDYVNGVYLIETYEQLRTAAAAAYYGRNVKLVADIEVDDRENDKEIIVQSGGTMSLDLNGHTLKRSTMSLDSHLIVVEYGAQFNIYDSSDEQTGQCIFHSSAPVQTVGVILNSGGQVIIENGTYLLSSDGTDSFSGVITADSGITIIQDGYFDATGCGQAGSGVLLLHWAYLYETPVMFINGGTFFANDGIHISPFDRYIPYGSFFPVVFMTDGTFHITGENEYSGFSYCNNGWGHVYVGGGTIPTYCVNTDSYRLASGSIAETVYMENPAGKRMAYYEVSNPVVLYDSVDSPDIDNLILLRLQQDWAKRYSNSPTVLEHNPMIESLQTTPRTVMVDRKQIDPVTMTIFNPGFCTDIKWYRSTDGQTWEHLPEYDSRATITIPRPQEAAKWYYLFEASMVGDHSDTVTDQVLFLFQAPAQTTVLDQISFHLNQPEDGQKPSKEIYIDATTLGGYSATNFQWMDKTTGQQMGANESFIAGHKYEVQITLEAEEDFAFAVDGDTPALQALCNYQQAHVSSVGGATPDQAVQVTCDMGTCPAVVSTVKLDLCPPAAGAERELYPNVGTQNFTVYTVDWFDVTENRFMEKGELFQNGHHYTVQVWLEIDDGFQFANDGDTPQVKATINGKTAPVTDAYEQALDDMIVVNYDFGVCDSIIDTVHVVELISPVAGEYPVPFAMTPSEQYYVSTIQWSGPDGDLWDSDQFKAGVTYTAAIHLLPVKHGTQYLYSFADQVRAFVNDHPVERVEHLGNALTVYVTYTCTEAVLYGDVDENGKVEATDALEVLKSVVGKVTLTDQQLKAADTDGNGKADATDALNILKKVVGKIDKFAVEQ